MYRLRNNNNNSYGSTSQKKNNTIWYRCRYVNTSVRCTPYSSFFTSVLFADPAFEITHYFLCVSDIMANSSSGDTRAEDVEAFFGSDNAGDVACASVVLQVHADPPAPENYRVGNTRNDLPTSLSSGLFCSLLLQYGTGICHRNGHTAEKRRHRL